MLAADTPPPESDPASGPLITAIAVRGLLGKFDYTIDFSPNGDRHGIEAVNDDRLILLYGRNGTGKTSLLKMLFHALSTKERAGHRTHLIRTGFRSLRVELAQGSLEYDATDATAGGELRLAVTVGEATAKTLYSVETDDDGRIRVPPIEVDPAQDLLQSLSINPIYLSDSRSIESDVFADDGAFDDPQLHTGSIYTSRRAVEEALRERRDKDLRVALERIRGYLNQLVVTGAQRGSQRVDAVYVNVAQTVVEHASRRGRPYKGLVGQLHTRIDAIAQRVQPFREYGLITEFPAATLIETVERAEERHGWLLTQVLGPYLDGLTERMDALNPGLSAIRGYVEAVNSFLEGKRLDFRLGRGVAITDTDQEEILDPFDLSSGEKQILLLLSNIVALRDQTKLFLIDEPELSLNPQWQRRLMPSLLGSSAHTEMQLVAATHSIEIMARYRDRLRPLD